MANYTYHEENPKDGKHPWIDKLELIDPVDAPAQSTPRFTSPSRKP